MACVSESQRSSCARADVTSARWGSYKLPVSSRGVNMFGRRMDTASSAFDFGTLAHVVAVRAAKATPPSAEL